MPPDLSSKAVALKAQHPEWGYQVIAKEIGSTRHHVRRWIEHAERNAAKVQTIAVAELEPQTVDEFVLRITACWRKSVDAIIEVGRLLANAKAQLPHGQFEAMISERLPFGVRTVECLMAIGRDERIANPTHASLLPPHWATLYDLTKLTNDEFDLGVINGVIRPDMERKDVGIEAIHKERRRHVQRALSDQSERLCESGRKFPVIYADPATKFLSGINGRSIENHYRVMTTDELCFTGPLVQDRCLPDCAAFIWSTVPQLANTITQILPAWGFAYSSSCVWDKTDPDHETQSGMGLVFRNQHEILIYATRGRPVGPTRGTQPLSIYRERKAEHSRKPEYFRGMILEMTGYLPVLELFARVDAEHPMPDGFTAWGNESEEAA